MRASLVPYLGIVIALLGSLPSCADESIVLATVPATDSGAPPVVPVRCIDSSTCPNNTFCAKADCSAGTTGTCELSPAFCDPSETPVCGCDGITYFNDCLRQSASVVASTPGECPFDNAVPCAGDQNVACPDGTQSCARLQGFKGSCDDNFPGTCWVLPATCPPPPPGADRWNSCSTTTSSCVDTCTAIASGGVYRRSPQCAPAP